MRAAESLNENKYTVYFYFAFFLNKLMKLVNFGPFIKFERQQNWQSEYSPQPTVKPREHFKCENITCKSALKSPRDNAVDIAWIKFNKTWTLRSSFPLS